MKRCRNCVTVYNAGATEIPAYTPVAIGRRMDGSGLSDDFCFEAVPAGEESKIIGIADCLIYPGMPGRAVVSGLAAAKLAGFFEQGDLISPGSSGGWEAAEDGKITVVSPADENGIGTVLLSPAPGTAVSNSYDGYFNVKDASRDGKYIIRIRGGETDVGWVDDAELDITGICTQMTGGVLDVDLVAQYINGEYTLHFSADTYSDEKITEQYFGSWLLASVYLKDGKLGIIQQWHNGAIYFGERYWVK